MHRSLDQERSSGSVQEGETKYFFQEFLEEH
jgi:hypothetical protein